MYEFLNKVESFCDNGGFLQIGLRDPETLRAYAETAQKLRRNNKSLSHDEKMILTRIEVIFCGAYGDIDRQIIDLSASLQHKDNDLRGYLRCFHEKEGSDMKYKNKSFVQSCLDEESVLSDLDDWIKYWQTHSTGKILMDFLGLDPTEYRNWAESDDRRNNDRDFWTEVMESRKLRRKKVC